jgi:Protein of unknown function (DUF4242)
MPKYIIERHIPGAASLSQRDLQAIAMKSNRVLNDLGPSIQWMHSYVTGDRLYCVYIAPSPDMIREHAKRGEFPVNEIMEVKTVIDPVTAEG